jgi:predicted alpha/beta-hydrolase family hydrolase
VDTPHGTARAHLETVARASAAVVLGHGAGGGIAARDLLTAAAAARELGLTAVLVEQPYRVAGRRSPAPAHQLDRAWLAVIEQLRAGPLRGLALVTGGRSSGARVACRTAAAAAAAGVICLAFPLQPPPRSGSARAPDRLSELDAVTVPVLVVQGRRDRFGMPPPAAGRTVVQVAADHALRTDLAAVGDAVRGWLQHVVQPAHEPRRNR